MRERTVELLVGLFLILGVAALMVLSFKVSGLTLYTSGNSYQVKADFDDIGGLKRRAAVTVAGVRIGQVTNISLDKETYKAIVTMNIDDKDSNIPTDSSASIVTAGLLGANYIALMPGFDEDFLKEGDLIEETHSALQLETMIGQLIFSMNKDDAKSDASE